MQQAALKTLLVNDFGRVEIMPPRFDGGEPRVEITITALPADVTAAMASKKIRPALPRKAYVNRQAQIAGKWVDKQTLKLDGLAPQISIENRPGLAQLWHEADDYEQGLSRQHEERKAENLQRFIDACPTDCVIVRPVGSIPDPYEAGMSITVWGDGTGREYAGTPDIRFEDGSVAHIKRDQFERLAAKFAEYQKGQAERKAAQNAVVKAEKDAEANRVAGIFESAKQTGKPQVLNKWVTDKCTRNNCDCDFDAATKFALPDGTTRTEYVCCH